MADTPEHEPSAAADKTEAKAEAISNLPTVYSPSISPAESETIVEDKPTAAPAPDAVTNVTSLTPRFKLSPRQKRQTLFAASVMLAASCGAVFGALIGGAAQQKPTEVVHLSDSQATQQAVANLTKELAALKSNVDAAGKTMHAQFAKIGDKLAERSARDTADVTGSIAAPSIAAPLPMPKPSQHLAALENQARPVVADWSIRTVQDGFVFVQGHGEIYQVAIGAPLPGLGPVEQVKRQDGRWIVVTPKGVITQRDRGYLD